jgi:VCBS repeat-containing protein
MTKIKAIALAVWLALTTLLLASAPASADGRTVHIRGDGAGTIRVNTTTGALTGEESGFANHLGKFTVDLQGTATISADGTVNGNGTLTIVTANGDQLTGTFTVTGREPTLTVAVTITGGTGRFAHASGTLTVTCVLSGPPRQEGQVLVLENNCTVEGRISYSKDHPDHAHASIEDIGTVMDQALSTSRPASKDQQ